MWWVHNGLNSNIASRQKSLLAFFYGIASETKTDPFSIGTIAAFLLFILIDPTTFSISKVSGVFPSNRYNAAIEAKPWGLESWLPTQNFLIANPKCHHWNYPEANQIPNMRAIANNHYDVWFFWLIPNFSALWNQWLCLTITPNLNHPKF